MVLKKVFLCLCLLVVCQGRRSYAQQQQPAEPAQAKPAQPAEPAQAKPAQPAEQKMAETKPAKKKKTRPAGQPDTGDGVPSVTTFYWLNPTHPVMRTGRGAAAGVSSDLNFPGKNKPMPGVIASIPTGDDNTLRISYFRTQAHGDTVASKALNIFGVGYSSGDFLSTRYKLQNVKISWDYLTWPFPQEQTSFRVKTFYELQYTTIQSVVDAPFKPIMIDSSGNAISNAAEKSNWFLYPSFGVGIEKFLSEHFRVEAKASGFAIPHFSTLWDADAFAAYRIGHIEIQAGAKAFHFKTSPKREEYVSATLPGAYVSLRWYPKKY